MQNTLYYFIILSAFFLVSAFGQLEECFNHWDSNKDGRVTIEEFPGGKENLEYFKLIDKDNNNSISKEELRVLLETSQPQGALNNASGENKALEQQMLQFRGRAEQLEQENSLLKRQIAEKSPSLDAQRQIPQLQAENQQWRKQTEELGREIQVLKSQIAQLQTEKTSGYGTQGLQRENQQLRKQLEDMGREVQSLKSQIVQLQNQLAQANKKPLPIVPQNPTVPQNPITIEETIANSVKKPASPAQDMLMAEEAARLDALRNLATQIRGNWIAACSQNIDAQNRLVVIGMLEPTNLVGVSQMESDFDYMTGMVSVPVQISRANIIESIRRGNPNMTAEDYQELRFMFPEFLTAKGYGAWNNNAQKRLMGFYGAQLDARRKLIEHLRGFVIKSSSRMENFVLQNHQVVVSIESTLLIGVNVLKEEIISNAIAQTTIEITRAMFIYSMRKGLEANGLQLTPEEYQNLRNMLSQDKYQFTGKSAVQ